jgi:hypothetical protein
LGETYFRVINMSNYGVLVFKKNVNHETDRESRDYYYVRVSGPEGDQDLLFTTHELQVAIARAKDNPEDCVY